MSGAGFIGYLQHRIHETKSELQGATDKMNQLQAQRDQLASDLQGYEKTLATEMRREGQVVPTPLAQVELPLTNGHSNKTEFAREFVRSHADTGITAADLFAGFEQKGIPIKKPYIYSLVQRLKAANVIRERRGKYYPILEGAKDQ
jgi:hypothetical protein